MDVMFEIPSENKKEYKVTLDYAKMQLEKSEYGTTTNRLKSKSKATENDRNCIFLLSKY